jgi:phospholipase/carboxylesterase
MKMRAWYDVLGFDRRSAEDEAGLRQSTLAATELIAKERGRGIAAERIVLAGFSQGGAVALYAATRHLERLAGVMALSTYLPLAGKLDAERAAANHGTSIFMAHGLADAVLPVALGLESRDRLKAAGYPVEWHQYPMAHSLCAEEVADIRSYLLRVLG